MGMQASETASLKPAQWSEENIVTDIVDEGNQGHFRRRGSPRMIPFPF